MAETRDRWGSRVAFIMAATGSAIGLGNIWRFPATAFENGGGAFLIPYFVALITAGIPLMILEYALGQKYQCGAPQAMAKLNKNFRWVGWFMLLVGAMIAFYYVIIMSYAWSYGLASLSMEYAKAPDYEIDDSRYIIVDSPHFKDEEEKKQLESLQAELAAALANFDNDGDGTVSEEEKTAVAGAEKDERTSILLEIDGNLDGVFSKDEKAAAKESDLWKWILTREEAYFKFNVLGGFETDYWIRERGNIKDAEDKIALLDASVLDLENKLDRAKKDKELFGKLKERSDSEENRKKYDEEIDRCEKDIKELPGRIDSAAKARDEGTKAQQAAIDSHSGYLKGFFGLNWKLVLFSLLTWIIIFIIIYKGVGRVGKVVMITVPLPVITLLILIVYGFFLPGAVEGLKFFFTPNWEILKSPSVWMAAYGQIFFSLSLGFGILIAYASYVPKDSDIANNAFITSFANCCYSFIGSFAVFTVLGYLAVAEYKGVADVVSGGPGLVFVTYPTSLAHMYHELPGGVAIAPIVAVIFFLTLLMLGIDSAFSIVEGVATGLRDQFPKINKAAVAAVVCGIGFLFGLIYCTRGGLMWLDIVDNWMGNYGLALGGLMECLIVSYFFKTDDIKKFINERSDFKIQKWWDACISVLTPLILIVVLGSFFLENAVSPYEGYDKIIPWSVSVAGWGLFGLVIFASFALGRNWKILSWAVAVIVIAMMFNLLIFRDWSKAFMASTGAVLLIGGLITTILIATKKAKENGGAGE